MENAFILVQTFKTFFLPSFHLFTFNRWMNVRSGFRCLHKTKEIKNKWFDRDQTLRFTIDINLCVGFSCERGVTFSAHMFFCLQRLQPFIRECRIHQNSEINENSIFFFAQPSFRQPEFMNELNWCEIKSDFFKVCVCVCIYPSICAIKI